MNAYMNTYNKDANNNVMMPPWSRAEDKIFEKALVLFPEGTHDRWWKIVEFLPGRSPNEIQQHYEALLHDIADIESGLIEPPIYPDQDSPKASPRISIGPRTRTRQSTAERKKGVPWTEEEHRLFLHGLEKYGKGDWRGISRDLVKTRTSQQVASHAQKYYLRQNSKGGKRASIHDITSPMPPYLPPKGSADTVPAPAPPMYLPVIQAPAPDMPTYLPDQGGIEDSIFREWYLQ